MTKHIGLSNLYPLIFKNLTQFTHKLFLNDHSLVYLPFWNVSDLVWNLFLSDHQNLVLYSCIDCLLVLINTWFELSRVLWHINKEPCEMFIQRVDCCLCGLCCGSAYFLSIGLYLFFLQCYQYKKSFFFNSQTKHAYKIQIGRFRLHDTC